MKNRIRVFSLLAVFALALAVSGPVAAQTGSGTGKITCDGDGVIVLSGDFTQISASVEAGALVHNTPTKGTMIIKSSTAFVKYISSNVMLYVGTGSGTAKNVKGLKMTLSGANGHIEATGTGKFAVRGDGSCTTAKGTVYTWTSTDTSITIAP